MYESVKVGTSLNFHAYAYIAYIASILFTRVKLRTRQWKSTFTGTEVVALKNRTTFYGRIYCLQFLSYAYV